MNANAPYVVFYLVATVFVASALVGRRLPLGKTLKMALAWIAIFLVAIAIALTIGRL